MKLSLPMMPMGQAASAPMDALPPLRSAGAAPTTPPTAGGVMQTPAQTRLPAPGSPEQSPYQVRLQPDGSSVYYIPGPTPQEDIVLGVNTAPKLPKALQPEQK